MKTSGLSASPFLTANAAIATMLALIGGSQGSPAQVPVVTVAAATQVASTNATIIGTVNPNGQACAVRVTWGTTIAYGNVSLYASVAAQNTPVPVTNLMIGLAPSTMYHYRLEATNSAGTGYSGDMTLTTTAGPEPPSPVPTVTVDPATQITSTGATVTGTVNPNGTATGFWVRWGTSTAYGDMGPVLPVGAQNTSVAVTNWMTRLSPNTTYHYQLVATNAGGSGYSTDLTLTTASGPPPISQPPIVTTGTALDITGSSATLYGTVSPNGSDATCFFRYGTNTAYGNELPSGVVTTLYVQASVSGWLSGLSPGTTYHYRLVATNLGGSAFGADQTFTTLSAVTVGDHVFTYVTNNGSITITAYSGPGGDVPIPSDITGLPVTTIGMNAFANNTSLTNVTIPNSITSIGVSAFWYCSGLRSVAIPGSVTNIGYQAFGYCQNLASLTISNGVITIGGLAFCWCTSLTSVTIPDSVTTLDSGVLSWGGPLSAFGYCTSLTNVTIGKGLTYLAAGTFCGCANLTSVLFKGDAPFAPRSYDIGAFRWADSAIVYYLLGTTGWGPTFSDRPTMLWDVQVQTAAPGAGGLQNRFGFNITGTPDIPVVIEACTDLATRAWVPVQSCTLTNGSLYFTEPDRTNNYPARFYRVRSP